MSHTPESDSFLLPTNPEHTDLLSASLRAPSAHNAQPWQLLPHEDGVNYELHYDQHPGLPEDIDNKDAYLTMGALTETLVLQAPNYGYHATVIPELSRAGSDLFIARVAITETPTETLADELSAHIAERHTNRNKYSKDPLPSELEARLRSLGNALVAPELLQDAVMDASIDSWANPRYIKDLTDWLRKDPAAVDGFTADQMHLSKLDTLAIAFAAKRGRLQSKLLRKMYSSGEVEAFVAAPTAAVIGTPDMTPPALFDAGRRLLRSWVTVNAAGYSYQPYSIAVDNRKTAAQVADVAGVENAVALYRVGKTDLPTRATSNRKPLEKVVVSP